MTIPVNNRFRTISRNGFTAPREIQGSQVWIESAMSNNVRGSSQFRRNTGSGLRPTTSKVRSAIFSMLGPAGPYGLRVLDIYAGTGALGIEALQRGATSATFIEQNGRRCEDIKKALERHKLAMQGSVQKGNALNAVGRLKGEFDLIFADPPYDLVEFDSLFERVHKAHLIAPNAIAFLEHSKMTDLPDSLPGLSVSTHRLYGDTAVSVYNSQSNPTQRTNPEGE
jgi:16S rRNA (guanine966-N2)-methyltransferase